MSDRALPENPGRAQASGKSPGERVSFLICKMGMTDNTPSPAYLPGYEFPPRQWSIVATTEVSELDRDRFKFRVCHLLLLLLLLMFRRGASYLNSLSPSPFFWKIRITKVSALGLLGISHQTVLAKYRTYSAWIMAHTQQQWVLLFLLMDLNTAS